MMRVVDRIGAQSDEQARVAFAAGTGTSDAQRWHDYLASIGTTNVDSGLAKRWLETVAMGANDEEMRAHVGPRLDGILSTYEKHLDSAVARLGFEGDESRRLGLAALIQAAVYGSLLEILLGHRRGHTEMLDLLDHLLGYEARPDQERQNP
ncbi:hypothetical protein ACFPM0_13255 [Pseudonocardia sulfidoxydans]